MAPSRSAFTLTLTTANTRYNIAQLIAAIDINASNRFRQFQIQSDPGNSGIKVYIGDNLVSAPGGPGTGQRCAYSMQSGDFGPRYGDVNVAASTLDLWAVADTNTALINVEGVQ
jgi:hypothetical protein